MSDSSSPGTPPEPTRCPWTQNVTDWPCVLEANHVERHDFRRPAPLAPSSAPAPTRLTDFWHCSQCDGMESRQTESGQWICVVCGANTTERVEAIIRQEFPEPITLHAPAAPTGAAAPTREDAGRTIAPWTPEQVELLNNYQTASGYHPFTCGSGKCSHVVLVAHQKGWSCPSCDYTQDWAHNFMTRPFRDPREFAVASPAARAPARAGTTEPDDATLLKDLEESYRADHRFATVADHPAIKDRVDRDVDSAIEPIAARLATLRAEVSRLRAAVVAHRSAKAVRTGAS